MPWPTDPESKRRSAATYSDPEYRRNRPRALERDRNRCQLRLDGCTHRAQTVDHKVPVSQGGGHGLANLQGACWHCHRKKSAQEGGGYRKPKAAADPSPAPRTAW